jgi:alkylation response protein AidB-like acyl-CoA dehydrogenase
LNFAFTEDQNAITDVVRTMLGDTCTPADLRTLLEAGTARDDARWSTICEMGLPGLLAPEAAGGLGMGLIDLVGIAEAAGYVALPEPLVELAGVTIPLLASLDDSRGWLENAVGGAFVAIGHSANSFVADADQADALLLDDGAAIHLVPRGTVKLERQESFDAFRRLFTVSWTPSPDTVVATSWGQAAERGAVLAAAQMIGLGQRCIDLAVAYARDRNQFGKPIGSYQAVKHLVANAQIRIEFARPVVHAAAVELPLDTKASQARIAHAKIAAGEAADLAARTAVQVFGAMGMTWEADVHFFLKRALALKGAWGTSARHMRTVIDRVLNERTGPDATFASELALETAP